MRILVSSDAKSVKFWHAERKGVTLTLRFGRIGNPPHTRTLTLADEAAVLREEDRLVAEKLAEGYVETTTPPEAPTNAVREGLEAALVEDPDDLAAHRAYADLLTERGDPRGEFISVQLALEDESLTAAQRQQLRQRERQLLDAHEAQWLGGLAPYLTGTAEEREEAGRADLLAMRARHYIQEEDGLGHCWGRGWLDRLEFRSLTINQGRALARLPAARLLRKLVVWESQTSLACQFEPGPDVPTRAAISAVAVLFLTSFAPCLASVRSFQLGWIEDEDSGHPYRGCAEYPLLPYIQRLPRLEELRLFGHGGDMADVLAWPGLDRLRVLQMYHLYHYPLQTLAQNPAASRLTHLLCFPHSYVDGKDEEYSGAARGAFITVEEVRALARSPHLRSLTHLQLRSCSMGDAGVQEIVSSGLLKRLKVLDLRHGLITDAGARLLEASPEARNLELLDLERNRLTEVGMATLREAVPSARVEDQQGLPYRARYFCYVGDNE